MRTLFLRRAATAFGCPIFAWSNVWGSAANLIGILFHVRHEVFGYNPPVSRGRMI
jgi:hypothetical protein